MGFGIREGSKDFEEIYKAGELFPRFLPS